MTAPPANAVEKSTIPSPAEPTRRNWHIEWIVLVVALAVTIAAALYIKQSVDRAKEVEFSLHCNEIQDGIVGRLYDHARILRSGVAFFNASEIVTREKWQIYTRLQKIEQQLPGIQGIGFSLLIPRKELAGHIQEIRSEGFPEYKIKPEGDRESYTSIVFLEPFDWRNQRAFGYDMFSEPVRREAMERARDMDSATLSGKVLLVQETDEDVQAGNLMYVPVYRKNMPTETIEQRRAAIYGWVYSPYRMNDLMNGILGIRDLTKEKRIHLQVFDGISSSPQSLLYESPPPENQRAWTDVRFTRQLPAEFNGHTWTLLFRQTSVGLTTAEYLGVWITLVGGIIITLLLFALTRTLLHSRANALRLEERTVDLQAERQRLASIIEGTRAGTWEWNVQTGETIFNEQWAGIIGYSLAELSPVSTETWMKYAHPDDLQKSDALLEKHLCGESGYYEFETRMMHKDGHWIWVLVRGKVASWSDDGKPLWMFGTHQDITERKKTETALRESEANYRSLNRAMPQPLALHEIICDDSGTPIDYRFLDVNPAFEKLTGKNTAEIIGRTVLELLPGTEAHWIETYGKVALSGEPIQFESNTAELDRYFDTVVYSPQTGQFAVIANDITERKKAETELHKIEKLESIGTLAGGIAHDFNNVLTGLYGNLALAKMKLANDHPGFRFLEAAEQSMLRTTLLTNRLLTFAKGGDPATKSLSLVIPIEDVVNLSLSGSNVKSVITSADNLWQVRVDQRQIEQVFANLTVNAREAMPDGGHLYITMENVVLADKAEHGIPGGRYLRISMTDEGTGITPDLLDKIFDPYFTTKEMGSGLGLATAYSIIDKHGGHISVASQLDKGTTFSIYLPASEVAEEIPLTQPGVVQESLTLGAKILVMDDEEMIRNMLNEMLGELGFAVETAVEGQQTIDMYRQAMDTRKPFEIVILDLTIPGGMGGQKAAKGILEIDPEAKMIVSSGYADDPIIANYTDHGFKGVASKPYNLNKLSGVLAQVMEKAEPF